MAENTQETEPDEGELAADYLEELLDIADLDGDINALTAGQVQHRVMPFRGVFIITSKGQICFCIPSEIVSDD